MNNQKRIRIIEILRQARNEEVKDWNAYLKYKKMLLDFEYTPDEYELIIGILVDILEL